MAGPRYIAEAPELLKPVELDGGAKVYVEAA